jgi:hypothetical protein
MLHPNCMSVAVPFVSRTSAPERDNDHESLNVRMADHLGVKYRLYLCIVNAVMESPCSPHARRISGFEGSPRLCVARCDRWQLCSAPRPASTSPPVERESQKRVTTSPYHRSASACFLWTKAMRPRLLIKAARKSLWGR